MLRVLLLHCTVTFCKCPWAHAMHVGARGGRALTRALRDRVKSGHLNRLRSSPYPTDLFSHSITYCFSLMSGSLCRIQILSHCAFRSRHSDQSAVPLNFH